MSRLTFNYITDIKGKKKRYPKDVSFVAFFKTLDLKYFIYAACTKSDYSIPEIIEVSEETYVEEFEKYNSSDVAENVLNNEAEVYLLLEIARQKYKIESQTIGSMLNLE